MFRQNSLLSRMQQAIFGMAVTLLVFLPSAHALQIVTSGRIIEPIIRISGPATVLVTGAVNSPGRYVITADVVTVIDVLRAAKGFAPRAGTTIRVINPRSLPHLPMVTSVDVRQLLLYPELNLRLSDGDI